MDDRLALLRDLIEACCSDDLEGALQRLVSGLTPEQQSLLSVGGGVIALAARLRRQRVEVLARLARRLGHDLRGPLLNLRLGLQVLAEADPDEREPLVRSLFQELDRTQSLMEALVDLARAGEPSRTGCRLPSVLHQALSELGVPDGVQLELEVEDAAAAPLDPDQQLTLFRHLLRNALGAAGPGGRVRIRLRGPEVRVEDSGPGVEPERTQEIFEPFAGSFPGGLGLGLTVCRRIVEAHGGTIRAERSEELGGACFVVRYPEEPPRG